MSKKRSKNKPKKKNVNINVTSSNDIARRSGTRKRKKKRRSKIAKVLGLVFGTIFSGLKLFSSDGNRFVTLGILVLIITLSYFAIRRNAYEILLDGVPISVISMDNNTTQEGFTTLAVATLESNVGTNVLVSEEVEFRPVNSLGRNVNTLENAIRSAADMFTYKIEAGLITVNGREIAIVASVAEAESISRELIQPFINEEANLVSSGFVEDMQIIPHFVDREEITSRTVALRRLTETSQESQVYEVVSGDTLSSIASRAGMTLNELIEYNPGFAENMTINIGDQVSLSVTVPLLSVITEEELIVSESIPYTIQSSPVSNEPVSFSRTIQTGVVGQLNETYHISRINGVEVGRNHVGTEVVAHPVDRIIEVGTMQ